MSKNYRVQSCLGVCALMVMGTFGCKQSEECEQSRLALAKTWEEVRNSAGGLKYARGEAAEQESETSKQERLKRWQAMEERAGLVQSAFISKQVTWDSAEVARGELQESAKQTGEKSMLVDGFVKLLDQANQEFEQYRGACR